MDRFDCTLNVFSSEMDELKETTKWIPEKLPPKNIDDPEVTSNDTSATSSSGNDPLKPKIKKREVWGQKIDFLLATVKPVHEVTFIKQSPVLKGHLFLVPS
jgi:hypothetical protein